MRRYYLDLFSGIGGFALGAYWAGVRFDEHYFSEIDKYAISIYQKRFPDAIPLGDITKIDGGRLPKGQWVISGGFPCQDISVAGKGAGLDGNRSGLWFEYARLIGEIRPRFAIMENVGALTVRGLDRVLGSLAEIGYDAIWQDLRASDVGAPHRRERIWIIAYPIDWNADSIHVKEKPGICEGENSRPSGIVAHPQGGKSRKPPQREGREGIGGGSEEKFMADPGCEGVYESGLPINTGRLHGLERGIYADGLQGGGQEKREYLANTDRERKQQQKGGVREIWERARDSGKSLSERVDEINEYIWRGYPDWRTFSDADNTGPNTGSRTAATREYDEMAYSEGPKRERGGDTWGRWTGFTDGGKTMADTPEQHGAVKRQETSIAGRGGEAMADTEFKGLEGYRADTGEPAFPEFGNNGTQLPNAGNNGAIEWERELRSDQQTVRGGENIRGREALNAFREWWSVEPDVGRVANGVPSRVDRLKGLGNSVVPEIPAMMWLLIKDYL